MNEYAMHNICYLCNVSIDTYTHEEQEYWCWDRVWKTWVRHECLQNCLCEPCIHLKLTEFWLIVTCTCLCYLDTFSVTAKCFQTIDERHITFVSVGNSFPCSHLSETQTGAWNFKYWTALYRKAALLCSQSPAIPWPNISFILRRLLYWYLRRALKLPLHSWNKHPFEFRLLTQNWNHSEKGSCFYSKHSTGFEKLKKGTKS